MLARKFAISFYFKIFSTQLGFLGFSLPCLPVGSLEFFQDSFLTYLSRS